MSAALRTGTAADSERLRAALQSRIDAALETPGASLTVAGRVLRRVEMRANGAELRLVSQASEDQLEGMVEMWRELQAAEASAATDAE